MNLGNNTRYTLSWWVPVMVVIVALAGGGLEKVSTIPKHMVGILWVRGCIEQLSRGQPEGYYITPKFTHRYLTYIQCLTSLQTIQFNSSISPGKNPRGSSELMDQRRRFNDFRGSEEGVIIFN